jgi:hypothetical protein
MNKLRKARPGLPRPAEVDEEEEGNADFDSDAEDDEDAHMAEKRRKFNRNKSKVAGDDNVDSSDSDSDRTASDTDISEFEDDAFTATGEGESVYSEKPAYIPSKQASTFAKSLQQEGDGAKGGRDNHKRAMKAADTSYEEETPSSKFRALYQRVRVKVLAFSRFLQLRRRGLLLRSLSVARCGLGPHSARVAAFALQDNSYLRSLDLSHNAIGHSEMEEVNAKALQELASSTGLHTLRLRQCGLFEEGLSALVKGANHAESSLHELDLSGNHCGPTGAAIIASARNLHADQGSFSLGFKPQQNDVFSFSKTVSAFHDAAQNQALSITGESKTAVK